MCMLLQYCMCMYAYTPKWNAVYCSYVHCTCAIAAPWMSRCASAVLTRFSHAVSLQTNLTMQVMTINGTILRIQDLIQVAMVQLVRTFEQS